MKKQLLFILFIAISFLKLSAQPYLYGVTQLGGTYNGGTLFQFNASTYNFQVKKHFTEPSFAAALKGKLLLASNNKLYGVSGMGGLFEFDPATDVYTKKADFVDSLTGSFSIGNLVQLPNGKIIGTCVAGGLYGYGTIWEFDITSNTITKLVDFDNSVTGAYPYSGVTSAPNGKLYGTAGFGGANNFGVLWEFDPQTNSLTVKHDFDNTTGAYPFGYLKLGTNGKLYGVCPNGGTTDQGTLFEYDITTSVLIKRVDFDGTNGAFPRPGLNQAANGLFYGTSQQGGQYSNGTLYSFDPVSGTVSTLHHFIYVADGTTNSPVIQASNGKLYGLIANGANNSSGSIYEYNLTTSSYSTVFNFDNSITGGFPFQAELIEVSITNPCANLIASSSATTILCNGGSSTITVSASGGTAPYSGTGNFTRTAGTYSFVVTDANGCIENTSVTITQPTPFAASSLATAINCIGGSSTITVSAIGGTPPYSGTGNFQRVAGTYSFAITDVNGCTANTTITVAEPVAFANTNSCINNNTLSGTEKWFSFVASSESQEIQLVKKTSSLGRIQAMEFYSGACNSLTLVNSVISTPFNDTLLTLSVNNLTAGSTYYIRAVRAVPCPACPNFPAEFDLCLFPNLQSPPYCAVTCNIICNGSFENISSPCPSNSTTGGGINIGMDVAGTIPWFNPTAATPDLFNSCNPTAHVPDNATGNQNALPIGSGQGYAGINAYTNGLTTFPQFREYIMAPLNQTLINGQCYYFEMYVSLADQSTVTVNSLGAYFSATSVNSTTQQVLSFTPQIINNTGQLTNYTGWTKIAGTFTASGNMKYVIIGNFKNNANSNILSNDANPSFNGSYKAYYYIDEISLQKMEVDAGNAAPVVCGQGVQLNAVTQNCPQSVLTYQWSPATGLSNPTILNPIASPTAPTTYTITISTPYGTCSVTDNVTVTVQSVPPAPPVISGSTTACSELTTYSVPLVTGISYTWSTSYNLTGVGNTATVNFFPANGGTITFVATNITTNCTASSSLTITPCCKNGNGKNFYNSDVSKIILAYGSSSVLGQTFSINGTFTVNQNLQFVNCDIKLGPDAKIDISPGFKLEIRTSHLYACTDMWTGIVINGSTATLIVQSNSLIEDAKIAVASIGGGKYVIDKSVFNKNYKGIVVSNYAAPMTTCLVTKSIFTCRNYSSINYPLITATNFAAYPTTVLITPYSGKRSFTGIEASSITNTTPIVFGSALNAGLKNYFDYMDFGIRVLYSNASIYNNSFTNITYPAPMSHAILKGIAVYAEQNKMTNYKIVVGGTGLYDKNQFNTCHIGVYTTKYHTSVNSNKFDNIGTGIYVEYGTYNRNTEILNNSMASIKSGIYCYEMAGAAATNIKNNKIIVYFYPPTPTSPLITNYGITVQNTFAGDAKAVITGNKISQAKTGIWLIGATKTLVASNRVSFNQNNAQIYTEYYANNTVLYGIRVQNSKQSKVKTNIVEKTTTGLPDSGLRNLLRGISIENTAEAYVFDNLLLRMGSGIRSLNTCTNSTLACNHLNRCYFGLNFDNAVVGDQINSSYFGNGVAQGNEWTNPVGPTKMYGNITSAIKFWYKNAGPYIPFPTGLISGSFNTSHPAIATSAIDFCSASTLITNSGNGNGRNQKFGEIVRNQLQYSTAVTAFTYANKAMLFKELKSDPAMITLGSPDDSVYQNFYSTVQTENIGALEQVNDLIIANDVAGGTALNNNISPDYVMESNLKTVNDIYLRTICIDIYEFIPADSAALEGIANQDPLTNGDAVYSARVLLRIDPFENTQRSIWVENTEETPAQEAGKIAGKIYPNPNNGLMQLDYHLTGQQSGMLVIYDLTGRKINTYSLINTNNTLQIEESKLNDGIYFYQILVDGKLIDSGKLIIVN